MVSVGTPECLRTQAPRSILGSPPPSQVLSSGFSPPGPVAPFFNPQGQEEVANPGHPLQGPHLAPARTHIARIEGPVVQLHLLHGGPGAQATYREGPQDRGLTAGWGSRQVLRADTSRSWLTSRSLGKRLTPRDCSEGLTAPWPLPVDWHQAPSSCSPPRCTNGAGGSEPCAQGLVADPPGKVAARPLALTCLRAQQLRGHCGPRSPGVSGPWVCSMAHSFGLTASSSCPHDPGLSPRHDGP